MNIVLIGKYNPAEILTGPEKVAKRLFHTLNEKGIEVKFIEYFFKYLSNSSFTKRLFGRELVSIDPSVTRLGIFKILHFLFKNRPKIVHVINLERYTIGIYLFKFLFKGKIITTFHGVYKYEVPSRNELSYKKDLLAEWLALKLSDKIIFVSSYQHKIFTELYDFLEDKVVVISNGVDEKYYYPMRKNIVKDSLNILFFNRNNLLIRGCETLIKFLNNWKISAKINLMIIGDILNIENTGENISYNNLGKINPVKLKEVFLESNVIINTCVNETFSLTVAEAMAAGVVPIISTGIGISEFIVHGKNGFLFDPLDETQLSKIINDIINSKYNLAVIASETVKIFDKLKWVSVTSNYERIYKI